MKRTVLLALGAVSSLLYVVTDIIASRRYSGYSYRDQEFSELTAQEAPTRRLMVVSNVIPYDLLVAGFAAGVRMAAGPTRAARITAAMLGGYAAFGVAGGLLFPMHTRERLAAGATGVRNRGHPVATGLMSLCVVMAMGFGSRLLGRRFRRYSYGTIAALVVPGIVVSTQVGKMTRNERTPWMGLAERVNIYATMLWIATLAIGLLRANNPCHPES